MCVIGLGLICTLMEVSMWKAIIRNRIMKINWRLGTQGNEMRKLVDLVGKKFGRLVVLERVENDKHGLVKWLCLCNCDNKKRIVVLSCNLKSGHTKSCGCWKIEKMTKHGHHGDKIYSSWDSMIQRCTNPNNDRYNNYGGRGITICKRWLNFIDFNEDMGKSWKPGLTIERKNNDLGYCKENCCWATRTEQNRNKRNNHLETFRGKAKCIAAWSEETGIPYHIIRWRINKGWPLERALTESVKKYKKRKRKNNG